MITKQSFSHLHQLVSFSLEERNYTFMQSASYFLVCNNLHMYEVTVHPLTGKTEEAYTLMRVLL